MKTRAMLAATAMLFSTVTPMASGAALAAVTIPGGTPASTGPDATTEAAMVAQCNTLASNHGPAWSGEPDSASIVVTYVSGPTEAGSHSIADAIAGTLEGAGTYTPAHIQFGNPYRNGGSVNMWANGTAIGGQYSASTYDFEGDFETVYSYAFNCTMTEEIETLLQGYYEVQGEHGESEAAVRANCDAFTAMGEDAIRPVWWGQDHGGKPGEEHCKFVKTADPGVEEEARPDEAGIAIEETQVDTLTAHEDAGEGYFDSDPADLGKILVCISPSTSTQLKRGAPGTWVSKHTYVGSSVNGQPGCNTGWWNTGATVGVTNLNTGSNNVVTIPIILP